MTRDLYYNVIGTIDCILYTLSPYWSVVIRLNSYQQLSLVPDYRGNDILRFKLSLVKNLSSRTRKSCCFKGMMSRGSFVRRLMLNLHTSNTTASWLSNPMYIGNGESFVA